MSRFFIYGVLPPLEFGVKPEISSKALAEIFELNLGKIMLGKAHTLRLWIDIANIYELLSGGNFDGRGNYSKSTLRALIAGEETLPDYVLDFFQTHEKELERREFFPELIAKYFQEEIKKSRGKFREFLVFEHDVRVLLAGFRAKKWGRDLGKELQFEDVDDPIVAATLMQKDRGGKFQFPMDYEDLERILDDAGSDPSKQHQGIARFRFEFYIKYFSQSLFSEEGILAYMIALWILEDFFALKREEGEKRLSNIVEREHVS